MLIHLDLFSGIGGFALVCQWVGIETIGFVEIDKYCQEVLRKHWPDVPIVEDIRDVEKIKTIANATGLRLQGCWQGGDRVCKEGDRQIEVCCSDAAKANGDKTESPAILITAGFPCQPFSVAGKRQSDRDDRYLWPETLAVIEAIKPEWVLLENVTGIINLALDTVLSDLEGAGYGHETLVIPACAVNAWHRRDRVWIIAYSNGNSESTMSVNDRKRQGKLGDRFTANSESRESRQQTEQEGGQGSGRGSEEVVAESRLFRQKKYQQRTTGIEQCDWWAVEPELGRVAHGIPYRVDRLKCLGNAIVPQVAYEIIKVIKQHER